MSVALTIPMEHGLLLAAILFSIGLLGVMVRRNIIFILMSLEIMLNACAMVFIIAGAHWGQADGQIMFMLILSVAAAEVAVGLGLLLQVFRRFDSLDIDKANRMRG
ncbi:MAG TPA: NADH-quinone oxidoreductase subunit NuoK [Gammaproteobacteria bacterium]|jgi:NADH-quinone oxidoreductase subunit K|nr:NADH-quinone oxidoreductase subunit NuoK [Gammaproteobacteria bacterium]HIG62780.1 NADH-quinone oxidoreductase subunit NuoK [Gammaproteobacteria bacterium]|tara:strand:+ start:570 stop:887 length:318 start_codon:yes stop_codon:yes gene_type:complete